jgi:hypothetical protein
VSAQKPWRIVRAVLLAFLLSTLIAFTLLLTFAAISWFWGGYAVMFVALPLVAVMWAAGTVWLTLALMKDETETP